MANRDITISYQFELTVNDVKVRCRTTPGDQRRARKTLAEEGLPTLDELFARDNAGADVMEFMVIMAWLAVRHEQGYETMGLEEFGDACSDIVVLAGEDGPEPVRPTGAGPSNG